MTVAAPAAPADRPVSAFTSHKEFADAALVELNRRLAPAKLADSAANGVHLAAWLRQNAQATPQSVGEFADLLEQAIKATVFDRKLVWIVEPKALAGPNRPEKPASAAESEAKFAKWQKDAETKTKYDADQRAAEKRIVGLIAAFAPCKVNRLDYKVREETNAKHRGWLASAKASGRDLLRVEEDIRNDQQAIYHKLERSTERM